MKKQEPKTETSPKKFDKLLNKLLYYLLWRMEVIRKMMRKITCENNTNVLEITMISREGIAFTYSSTCFLLPGMVGTRIFEFYAHVQPSACLPLIIRPCPKLQWCLAVTCSLGESFVRHGQCCNVPYR